MKYNSALVVVLALLHPSHRRLMARDVLTFRFFFFFPFPQRRIIILSLTLNKKNVFSC